MREEYFFLLERNLLSSVSRSIKEKTKLELEHFNFFFIYFFGSIFV